MMPARKGGSARLDAPGPEPGRRWALGGGHHGGGMRVGVVGAGFIGAIHLGAYANMPEVEVVGVADANRDSAAAGARLVGARPYATYDDLR